MKSRATVGRRDAHSGKLAGRRRPFSPARRLSALAFVTPYSLQALIRARFRYAASGIMEVIPHPVLCRMSVGFGFETIRLSVWVRHKSGRH